ncbi:hypothetical protein RHMOL_Rhmol13G0017300 [Rhododendron molle]|uniref:Uncharacterized protein n=1 Tax=Rhododendron molle TaxID=49168 RepID=A0ACC0L1Y5_RHOML|nr:hypothetical protein RHMOL_Rhmol13G0017300 [Rhododendron molle]
MKKVHGEVFSSATQRVLACLYEKELDFEFVPVGMRTGAHKKQPFLSLNPFGLVPAFEDGDMTLFDKGTQLIYDGKKMAIASVWMDVEAHQFDPAASKLGGTADAAAVQEKEAKLVQVLDIYEVRLAQFKYLGGDDFTLVDLHHLPRLQRLMGSQMKKLVDSRPHVSAWCADILARPAWLKVLAMQANN